MWSRYSGFSVISFSVSFLGEAAQAAALSEQLQSREHCEPCSDEHDDGHDPNDGLVVEVDGHDQPQRPAPPPRCRRGDGWSLLGALVAPRWVPWIALGDRAHLQHPQSSLGNLERPFPLPRRCLCDLGATAKLGDLPLERGDPSGRGGRG